MEFEDVSYPGARRGLGKQDPPINYDLMVSYEELFTGATKKMKVDFVYHTIYLIPSK